MDKKILMFSVLAVLALTGCQISDLNADQSSLMAESDKVIGFTTYTGRTVTKSTDLNQSFNVESFLSGASSRTQFFTSTTYQYSDNKYTGDVNHYWPSNTSQNLDFYAVSPLKYTNTDSTEVDLTPAADSTIVVTKTDGTTDIVASRTLNAPNGTTPAPVNLTFGHKLTKVSFTAVGKDTTKKYVITDLKLNANSTSTYQFGASESWGDSSDEYRYDYVTDSVTVNNTSKPKSLGTKYLIPKQADNLTASIWYKVYEGSTLIDDHSADSVKVTLPVKNVWGVNKNVVYALTIDIKGNLIEFSPVVLEDWDTETVIFLPQLFSVSATKKVKFTKGNLYCNTTTNPVEWHLEANQYDYRHMNGLAADSASINGIGQKTPVGTVGSFFWSKTASVAYAQTYSDPSAASTDYFFCDENHKLTVDGQSGLYALSKDEWKFGTRVLFNKKKKFRWSHDVFNSREVFDIPCYYF